MDIEISMAAKPTDKWVDDSWADVLSTDQESSLFRWILNDPEDDPSPLDFNSLVPPPSDFNTLGPSPLPQIPQNDGYEEVVIEELFRAAEMVEKGHALMADRILAPLNNQISPVGKPFHRAAFSFKQTLQHLLLQQQQEEEADENEDNNNFVFSSPPLLFHNSSPSTLIHILGAYKSFSEISPVLHFANFTSVQSLLEQLHRYDKIHLIDFDIGFGGHWASFMQELSMRNITASISLKITAIVYPEVHGEVLLRLIRHNLTHFAAELKLRFELEMVNSEDSLHLISQGGREDGIGVNLPMGCSLVYKLPPLELLVKVLKQASVKVIVCMDMWGGERGEMSFPESMVCCLRWYWGMLESIEGVCGRGEVVERIEKFVLGEEVEKRVFWCHRFREKRVPWRRLFLSWGISPIGFSNFCESQAELLVRRSMAPWFRVERRQLSLILFWQRKELVSVSAWRC